MPIIMAELMSKVENLTEKVDLLATEKRTQRPVQLEGKAMFVPSHRNTMNTKAVCKLLHVKPLAIYRMVSAGEIPYFKQGKSLGFFEDEIFTWLEKRKGQTKEMRSSIDATARDYCLNNSL